MNMTLSFFVLTNTIGDTFFNLMYFAEVSVTTETGRLWWKKKVVERRKIAKEFGGSWFFIDNGERCPYEQVDNLERAYRAREKLALEMKNLNV